MSHPNDIYPEDAVHNVCAVLNLLQNMCLEVPEDDSVFLNTDGLYQLFAWMQAELKSANFTLSSNRPRSPSRS